jgi:bifunctional non-homologous end joining protein LigD
MRPYRGRRSFDIVDPVVEPFWSGERVLAHISPAGSGTSPRPSVALLAADGLDVADDDPVLTASIGAAILARDAVVDGVISRQVALDGVGAAAIPEMRDRPGLLRNRVELDVQPRGPGLESAAEEAAPGFVAVDLLRVDGISLLDVPLLERKRVLESVIRPEGLVMASVHVRPPMETWVATWKSMGLRGGMLKAANSRYLPGDDSIEWRVVEDVARRHG